MSTKAQTKANKKNAKKSTGPKTSEGKAVASKNAVKHGLFAAEAVVTGENQAEYEAYHDQFIAELAPVGMVESMMAARIVSLAWRLQRAERMQNQAIENMIDRKITNPAARNDRKRYCYNEGIRPGDPRFDLDRLPLGRISTSDWSSCKVLDRMLLYERRIESSLNKTIHNLKKYQMIRNIQEAEVNKLKTIPQACGFGAATQNNSNLKKRTQFDLALMDTTHYMQGAYGNMPPYGIEGNEPNSNPNEANQSQLPESALAKIMRKRKESAAKANSSA